MNQHHHQKEIKYPKYTLEWKKPDTEWTHFSEVLKQVQLISSNRTLHGGYLDRNVWTEHHENLWGITCKTAFIMWSTKVSSLWRILESSGNKYLRVFHVGVKDLGSLLTGFCHRAEWQWGRELVALNLLDSVPCDTVVPGTMRSGHQRKLSDKRCSFSWWEVKELWVELIKLRDYGKASQCLLEAQNSHSESCQIKERIEH